MNRLDYTIISSCCWCLLACNSEAKPTESTVSMAVEPTLRALAPGEEYAGKSLEDWAIEYMRWTYSQTSCASPASDEDGSLCGLYQDEAGPVFFLQTGSISQERSVLTVRTKCHIPNGKAVFVPIAAFSDDNVGVDPPLADADIEQAVAVVKASMRDLVLKADGDDVTNTDVVRSVEPLQYDYQIPTAPNFDSCGMMPGIADIDVSPSYLAGYFALFEPPTVGAHKLEYAGEFTWGTLNYVQHVTSSFTVDE